MKEPGRNVVQFGNLQLKYCERCGSLWLRRCGSTQVLCASCAEAESALADGSSSFLQVWSRLRAEVQA
jgi:Zn-finger nucleic acid-binding protein